MKRKNLFLFPILILISTLCFINVSCFSGFQEKGELSITFTESTIRQIMARGADTAEEQESFKFDPTENAYAYYIGATSGLSETFTLYVYNDLSYKVYSSKLISSIAADLEEKFKNLTTEDYLSNPELLEMFKNPLALYEDAIVSEGRWEKSGSSILITETHYRSAAGGDLTPVSNPSVIATIPQDAKYFTVQSNSGYVITFYASTKEDDYYDDEPVDSAKLLVRVVVGNIAYEKTLTVYSNTKAAHVEFTDLPVGVTAKVSALVYFDHFGEEREIYAKGESEEFVIQAGTNSAKIILREYNGEDEPPKDVKYNATSHISDEYEDAKKIFNGLLYFYAYSDNTYEIIGDVYDQDGYPLESKIFAKGTWEFSSAEDSAGYLSLIETDYFDFEKNKLISGADGGLTIDLSKKKFSYNGWSAVVLEFKMSGYEEEKSYPATGTQLALYNYDYYSDINNYSIYFVDSADASLDSSSGANFGYKSNYGSTDVSFCYDKDGNIYAFSCYYNEDLHRTIVTKDNVYEIPSSVLGTAENLSAITIDRKKDNLYVYGYSEYMNEDSYFIYSWPKTSLSEMKSSTKKFKLVTDSLDFEKEQLQAMFHSIKSFAVYNDQLYLSAISSSTLKVIKLDLSKAVYDSDINSYKLVLTDGNIASYNVLDEPLSGSPSISDILWQDDYLYVLVREVVINDTWNEDSSFRSRGALVRINLSSDAYNVLGWTNEAVDVGSAGIYFKKNSNVDEFYYEDAEHTKLFVMDGSQQMETGSSALISSYYPSLYIPDGGASLSEAAFYGPEKFIAIKPKKLVIADDGFAFYTNADGALSYRNVNRVVEVDLETFAITKSTEVSVRFAGDASSSFNGDYTRDITKDYYIADTGNFYYGSEAYEGSVYDKDGSKVTDFGGQRYFAIKCTDSE